MQESGVLASILRDTRLRVDAERPLLADWQARARDAEPAPPFAGALRAADVQLIAEVKRRSPSAGGIREAVSALELAEAYRDGGAAAISVLTEPDHFGGSLDDLAGIARGVGLPTLRKDFIIHEVQVYQARAAGAAAILLIVRALTDIALDTLASLAHEVGLATLVEIHSEEELDAAVSCRPSAIGVNARDLQTLVMDPALHERLIPRIPAGTIAVAESGLSRRADVERVAGFGADAVLVGTAVAGAPDPAAATRALVGVKRLAR